MRVQHGDLAAWAYVHPILEVVHRLEGEGVQDQQRQCKIIDLGNQQVSKLSVRNNDMMPLLSGPVTDMQASRLHRSSQ